MPNRGFYNMAMSVLDPELQRQAERITAAIPANHPLRSQIAQRLFGVFKAWAESQAERLPPLPGAALEKLTDFGDFMFSGTDKKGGATTKTTKAAQDWMDRFFFEAGKRLEKAADPQQVAERIKVEFELRRQILEAIEAVRKAAQAEMPPQAAPNPPTPSPTINWQELREKLNLLLTEKLLQTATNIDEAASSVASGIQSFNGLRDLRDRAKSWARR